MKTLFYTACLLLVLSGYSQWQAFALQVAELARQQLPQPIAAYFPDVAGAVFKPETVAGREAEIAANLKEALRGLIQSDSLEAARVTLKQVRFVPTPRAERPLPEATEEADEVRSLPAAPALTRSSGYYVATVNYDLLSPLTVESGATLLTAACSCGVAQLRLSDGYGVVKTFRCPKTRN